MMPGGIALETFDGTLADINVCHWLLVKGCGCVRGSLYACFGATRVLSSDEALMEFFDQGLVKATRKEVQRQKAAGLHAVAYSKAQWDAERIAERLLAACPHEKTAEAAP
jgi:hypothetical protein